MTDSSSKMSVYLSYVTADLDSADLFRKCLEKVDVSVVSSNELTGGDNLEDRAKAALLSCAAVVVLIGPQTRQSEWVDKEIELGIRPRTGKPGTGLLGVILKNHEDFSRPYYDAENVPLRLHDRVRWEYGLIKKWSEDPQLVQLWLDEAIRRAQHYSPAVNLKTLRALRTFSWNPSVDVPRPVLGKILESE